jgi:antitoxin HicB
MKTYTYTILLEGRDDDGGGWTGLVPDLPGLLLMGDTRDELLATASDAIADYIDAMREQGLRVPEPGESVATVTVPAA